MPGPEEVEDIIYSGFEKPDLLRKNFVLRQE